MSIEWTRFVWKESPYKGVQKLIHLYLAERADADGLCFPKQETIARETTASAFYVRKTIKQMVLDGLLVIIQKGRQYAYRLLRGPQLSCPPDRNTVAVETETELRSYIEPPLEQSSEPSETTAPAARGEEAAVIYGELKPDEPPRKDPPKGLPKRDTHAWCFRRFENEAAKVGHPRFNAGVVRRTIKELRGRTGSYEEVDRIIRTFFLRHEPELRATKVNLAMVFRNMLPQVEKEAAVSKDHSAVMADNQAQQDRLMAILMEGRNSA